MLFAMFHAESFALKPASILPGPVVVAAAAAAAGVVAPNWRLLANIPVLNLVAGAPGVVGQFNLQPLPAVVGVGDSVLGADVYSEIFVPPAHMIFDAATVGYGSVAAVQMMPLANLQQVFAICTYAQSRAPLLQSIYDFPGGMAAGPVTSIAQSYIEPTEKVHLSFVLGQTVAMCMARRAWGVTRLFHRSLYGPLLPALAPGMAPLPTGFSPDFLCLAPLPGGVGSGLCFVESKGTYRCVNQDTRLKDRNLINDAFEKQIAPMHNALPGGAYMCAVSLACRDEEQLQDRVVGQFWDPVNENAVPANVEAVHRLTAQYFTAMRAFLLSIDAPSASSDARRMVWHSQLMRIRVEMASWQWELMESLAKREVSEEDFYSKIEELDADYWIHSENGHNGDGLYLAIDGMAQDAV
jgi:hypothetical protein